MNRKITNIIRFFLDECLPPIIRENKYFMYPFFYLAYRGRNIETVMTFKDKVLDFTDYEYQLFYSQLNSISRNRLTDINTICLKNIINNIDENDKTVIDIGCSHGYLLDMLFSLNNHLSLYGCDIVISKQLNKHFAIQANIHNLPFKDNSFDIVSCNHTLEHIKHLKPAINELIRISKNKLIITVPCQRYYYYTLDEHIHFFTHKHQLIQKMGLEYLHIITIKKLWGDWFIVIDCKNGITK